MSSSRSFKQLLDIRTLDEVLRARLRDLQVLVVISFISLFNTGVNAQESNSEQDKHEQQQATETDSPIDLNFEQSLWSFMHPYTARYIVSSDGDEIGYSNRELSQTENIWQLSTNASVNKYFLKMTSRELSRFALINNKLNTLEFDSKTKISFKKERRMSQIFDWRTGIEMGKRGKKQWQLEHSKIAYDRASHLLQMRADLLAKNKELAYNVSYKGKLHDYNYKHLGEEAIDTKMGKLNAIKLSREKPNGDIFIVWMSPELNYFPVKIAQIEDDKPDITMTLDTLEYTFLTPSTKTDSTGIKPDLK